MMMPTNGFALPPLLLLLVRGESLFEFARFLAIPAVEEQSLVSVDSCGIPTAHSTAFFSAPRPARAASSNGEADPLGRANR
jgi:hypothetical protein